jgi:hypothetical protein
MKVRVENLAKHPLPDDLDAPAYRSVGRQTMARVYLLHFDIWRVVRQDRSLTSRRVAEMVGLGSDWIVRDIRKPEWFVKNVEHLFRIEEVLSKHPLWQPKVIFGEMCRGGEHSFVYRRWVDPYHSPEFQADVRRWRARRSDAEFIELAKQDPWVSIIDIAANDPYDYRVIHYAPAMIEKFGFSKNNTKISDHPSPAYAEILANDLRDAVVTGEARCKDVVHLYASRKDRVVFRNITLPCLSEGKLVSRMKLEHWEPGRLRG